MAKCVEHNNIFFILISGGIWGSRKLAVIWKIYQEIICNKYVWGTG